MSYLQKWFWTIVIVAVVFGVFWGRWLGRAEMKRWQDAYYAPLVKQAEEVHLFRLDGAGIKSVCLVIDAGRYECNFEQGVGFLPPYAPTPKLPKSSKPVPKEIMEQICDEHNPLWIGGGVCRMPEPEKTCLVGQEKNRVQDVCCPAYLEVNDCSWHHGTNPRESKP